MIGVDVLDVVHTSASHAGFRIQSNMFDGGVLANFLEGGQSVGAEHYISTQDRYHFLT
ncbi:hypothetical protein URH17368_0322 [Alicyclobacillus hesperidum URH17-3-68]|nr:hypothetical protein URH17368_0322 [Alicyclobacillus hesperidum URH17-3-68]